MYYIYKWIQKLVFGGVSLATTLLGLSAYENVDHKNKRITAQAFTFFIIRSLSK
jgi:hypothetical protein